MWTKNIACMANQICFQRHILLQLLIDSLVASINIFNFWFPLLFKRPFSLLYISGIFPQEFVLDHQYKYYDIFTLCLSLCIYGVPSLCLFFCVLGLVQSVSRPWTGAERPSPSRRALKTGRCSQLKEGVCDVMCNATELIHAQSPVSLNPANHKNSCVNI